MLCVPTIVKNLLSVSQLAQDNAIFIEFYGDHCLIKDKVMGRRLLRGELSNGLYWFEGMEIVKDGRNEDK